VYLIIRTEEVKEQGEAQSARLEDALLRPAKKLDFDFGTSIPNFTCLPFYSTHSVGTRP
jgi:hypothetical protein